MKWTKVVYFENSSWRCVLDFTLPGRAFLHLRVYEWNRRAARQIQDRLTVLLQILPQLGVPKLESFMHLTNERAQKMARRAGFLEVRRNAEFVLMEQSCQKN